MYPTSSDQVKKHPGHSCCTSPGPRQCCSRALLHGPLSNSKTTRQGHKTFRELLRIPVVCWVCNAFDDKLQKKKLEHSRSLCSARIGQTAHRKWIQLDSLVDSGEPRFQTSPAKYQQDLSLVGGFKPSEQDQSSSIQTILPDIWTKCSKPATSQCFCVTS